MVEGHQRPPPGQPKLLIRKPETCLAFADGALVGIRRAMLTAGDLETFGTAIETASASSPGGLIMLSVFRLDRRFPIQLDFDADLSRFVQTLRAIDRRVAAVASVLEFGGVRASAMRIAARTVWRLGQPRSRMAFSGSAVEGANWLAPYARMVGAPIDPAAYLRMYRLADRTLREIDEEL